MAARPARVLVVDDDFDIRMCVGDLLVSQGYEVLAAANGAEALRALDECRFDVIVLDLSMPVMSGWQFLEEIAHRPDRDVLRVIVLSASLGEFKLPVDRALAKPTSVADLLGAVEECLPRATG